MLENVKNINHAFSSKDRKGIFVSGVVDVISFDERTILCETACGNMAIEGEGLHITVLSIGEGKIEVEGKLDGLYYYEPSAQGKRKLFGKK